MPIDVVEEVVQKTNDGRLMADLRRLSLFGQLDASRPISDGDTNLLQFVLSLLPCA